MIEQFAATMLLATVRMTYSKILEAFNKESDYAEGVDRLMSLKRFLIVCDERRFFLKELLNVPIEDLRTNWPAIKRDVKLMLVKSKRYTTLTRKICNQVDASLEVEKPTLIQSRQMCLMVRIVKEIALQRLVDSFVDQCAVPDGFLMISERYGRVISEA